MDVISMARSTTVVGILIAGVMYVQGYMEAIHNAWDQLAAQDVY